MPGDGFSTTVCGGDQAAVSARSMPGGAAAAPNTYSDSGGTRPGGCGGCARAIPAVGRSRCCCVPAVPAIQGGWLVPRRGVPFVAARVRGRRRGLVPGGGRWAGEALGHPRGLIPFEWPASAVLTPGTWPMAMSPFSASPVLRRRRCSHQWLTSMFSFGAVFVLVATGGIGVPSNCLAARGRAPTARLGLNGPVVAVRGRSGSRVWLPFGTGSPIPPCVNGARTGPRRRRASCAACGTRPGRACAPGSTARVRCRASTGASPGGS